MICGRERDEDRNRRAGGERGGKRRLGWLPLTVEMGTWAGRWTTPGGAMARGTGTGPATGGTGIAEGERAVDTLSKKGYTHTPFPGSVHVDSSF